MKPAKIVQYVFAALAMATIVVAEAREWPLSSYTYMLLALIVGSMAVPRISELVAEGGLFGPKKQL